MVRVGVTVKVKVRIIANARWETGNGVMGNGEVD